MLGLLAAAKILWDNATVLATQLKLEPTCDHRQDGTQGGTHNNNPRTQKEIGKQKIGRRGRMRRERGGRRGATITG